MTKKVTSQDWGVIDLEGKLQENPNNEKHQVTSC